MDKVFDSLAQTFKKNGYNLYMIGSSSRDFLLKNPIDDYDFVSDATPSEIQKFLDVETVFKKYGVVKYKFNGIKIDIATLRIEANYLDSRHPNDIEFTVDIKKDYIRRDFTINCIYIDSNYKVIDPTGLGVSDLKNHILRFIGDPLVRIKEDPLRILRAKRFILRYNLKVDEVTKTILNENIGLLKKINKDKIAEEFKKMNLYLGEDEQYGDCSIKRIKF